MVRAVSVFILFLGASCAPPSGGAGAGLGSVSWESEARAIGKGRDGQLMIWASESPSLIVAAPGEKPGSADLMYSSSKDEGGTFAHPLRVNPLPGEVSAHGENAPQLRLVHGSAILAAWEGRGDIRFARCVDFGRSFLPAVTVNDDAGESYQSFFSMETGPDGAINLAWIDFRDTKSEPPGTASIYLSRSTDQGATFEKNVKVAGGVCPCCRPAIAIEKGAIHVAWRHVLENFTRDVVLATSRDQGKTWTTPIRVAVDDWRLDGCPHSGPTMISLPGGVFIAWYTAVKDKARLQLSRSRDGGRTFEKPVPVESSLFDSNHPHLVGVAGEPWVIFQARTPDDKGGWGPPKAAVVRCDEAGRPGSPMILPSLGGSVTYPRLSAGNAGRLYATWTETGADGNKVVLCRGRREVP